MTEINYFLFTNTMIHLSIGENGVIVNYFRSKNTKVLPELGCKSVDLIFNTPNH